MTLKGCFCYTAPLYDKVAPLYDKVCPQTFRDPAATNKNTSSIFTLNSYSTYSFKTKSLNHNVQIKLLISHSIYNSNKAW